MTVHELRKALPPRDLQVLDVRTPNEWQSGHVPGATYIFLPELQTKLDRLGEEQARGGVLRQRLPRKPGGQPLAAAWVYPGAQRAG